MKASQIGDANIVKMLIGAGASLDVKAKVILYYMCLDNHSHYRLLCCVI